LTEYGKNAPSPPKSQWFRKTIGYLFGGFGAILFIAAILVFIAWKPLGQPPALANLALAIVLVIVWVVQAAFSFWQDFSTSRVMESIGGMLPDACMVLRDGNWNSIDAKNIVPGDVIQLNMGNKLPADVRIVECSSARLDRSILTGEVCQSLRIIYRHHAETLQTMPLLASVSSTDDNYLETATIGMAGTSVVSGKAIGLVVSTGDKTVFGRVSTSISPRGRISF
jgi:sodium/potassium-transporting ATPase subunit alpha